MDKFSNIYIIFYYFWIYLKNFFIVDEFVNLLMPLNETTVINDICTDTLGGITAIDPLKFAEEFIKRRKMDQNDPSFSAVRGYNSFTHDDSRNSNKFIPVKSSGRKKNRQNLN